MANRKSQILTDKFRTAVAAYEALSHTVAPSVLMEIGDIMDRDELEMWPVEQATMEAIRSDKP